MRGCDTFVRVPFFVLMSLKWRVRPAHGRVARPKPSSLPIFLTERVSINPPEQKTWQINTLQRSHEQTHKTESSGFFLYTRRFVKKFHLGVDGAPAWRRSSWSWWWGGACGRPGSCTGTPGLTSKNNIITVHTCYVIRAYAPRKNLRKSSKN